MNHLFVRSCLFLASLLAIGSGRCQTLPDLGYAKVTIQKLNSGESPVTYTFSTDQGCVFGFSDNDGTYADGSFNGDFEKGSTSTFVQVLFRIMPPAKGTFLLPNGEDDEAKYAATLSVNLNNNLILFGGKKGTSGKIDVIRYPATGEFLTGSFEAVLNDSPDPGSIKNLYKVSGQFKIKKL